MLRKVCKVLDLMGAWTILGTMTERGAAMTQLGLGWKREFLDEMRRVAPRLKLIALIEPHYPKGRTGRPPFLAGTMLLQIHFTQQWFGLSDPAMEEPLCDVPLYRDIAGLDRGTTRLPNESTILRFHRLLEAYGLAEQMLALINEILSEKGLLLRTGSAIDATLVSASSSTKDGSSTRGPEIRSTQKMRQLVLPDEGAYRRGRRVAPSSHRHRRDGQRPRHQRDRSTAARWRSRYVCRCCLSGY
ncbi:IS5 family transposase [Paraburkholderia sp. BL9I2N2]|nr:IS5 family transposase [Paraburkholderia sp. BL9I2N2]